MREKGDRLSRQRGKGSFSGPAWGGREGGAEGRRGNVPSKLAAVLRTSVPFLLQYHQAMLAAASWKGEGERCTASTTRYHLSAISSGSSLPRSLPPFFIHRLRLHLPPPLPPLYLLRRWFFVHLPPPPFPSSCLPQVRFSSAVSLFSRKGDP